MAQWQDAVDDLVSKGMGEIRHSSTGHARISHVGDAGELVGLFRKARPGMPAIEGGSSVYLVPSQPRYEVPMFASNDPFDVAAVYKQIYRRFFAKDKRYAEEVLPLRNPSRKRRARRNPTGGTVSAQTLTAIASFIVAQQRPDLAERLYGVEAETIRRADKLKRAVLVKQGLLEKGSALDVDFLAASGALPIFESLDHEGRLIALEYLRKPFEKAWKVCREPVAMMMVANALYPPDNENQTDNKELIGCTAAILKESLPFSNRYVLYGVNDLIAYSRSEIDASSALDAVGIAIDSIPPSSARNISLREAFSASLRNTAAAMEHIVQTIVRVYGYTEQDRDRIRGEVAGMIRNCLGTPSIWLALQ